ncbi:MAG: histidinol-phosphate transaminase [Bacteroidales bacterium]|jgi:histidinol-phosphate aminotransferase|nr:histidinol-phosphate transaminase [Bacteroidales bacterium]
MKNIQDIMGLARKNILELVPYSTARDECRRKMEIYLDANENPFENGVNRYPSPKQPELKKAVAAVKKCDTEHLFLGNGSDEPIDLIYRIFCEPGKSSAIVVSPSYGMYSVAAQMNDVRLIECLMDEEFNIDPDKILKCIQKDTKVIFLCSPNNPSGNLLNEEDMEKVIRKFNGIVVVDEAYLEFSGRKSLYGKLDEYPNLIILQTMSKAWGMAGLRIGLALAHPSIIHLMSNLKYPYNINILAQKKGVEILSDCTDAVEKIKTIRTQRDKLLEILPGIKGITKVFHSDANFILARFEDAAGTYDFLQQRGIIVRNRSNVPNCEGCLRIAVGTPEENARLLNALCEYSGTEKNRMKNEGSGIHNGRTAAIIRKTKETSVQVRVDLDKFSEPYISTGLHFFDHMLEQIAYHGAIGLDIICSGDLETDDHHTIEDVAIVLGDTLSEALGSKNGIERYGFSLPMDESDATVLLDLGGRIDFSWDAAFTTEKIGDVKSEMFEHFFKSLCEHLKCNLHIKARGKNNHHIIEGIFKAFARTLKCAVRKQEIGQVVPSSKGTL